MNRPLNRIALAVLLLILAVPMASAQQPAAAPRSFAQTVDEWRRTLDQVQATLSDSALTREELDRLRAQVDTVRQAAQAAHTDAESQRKPFSDQLAALGPPPAKGQPAESSDVARQRRQLAEQAALYDTRLKQAELTITRANGLERDVARTGNQRIAQHLLERGKPPLALASLRIAAGQLGDVAATLAEAPLDWWDSSAFDDLATTTWIWLGLLVLAAFGAGWPLRNWLLRRFGRVVDLVEPSYARRALAAGAEGVARGLLPAIGLLALAAVLLSTEIATGLLAQMVRGALSGIIFFSLTAALARAALSPAAPNWRIVPFGAEPSRILAGRLSALAAVAGISIGLHIATRELELDARELFSLVDFVLNTLIAALTLSLLQRRLWRADPAAEPAEPPKSGEQAPARWLWPLLRLIAGAALIAVPILALAGYNNLATHIGSRVVATGLLVGAFLLARTLLREVIALLIAPDSDHSAWLRQALTLTDQGSRILIFWLGVVVDLALVLPGAALALRLWGVPEDAIGLWAGGVMHGFEVGNLRLSFGDIALSILVFVAFWTATRLIQRVLRDKLLPQTRLDPSVRHSLSAMVGYVGFLVALALAITTLGLSLANIAIIAGALSVGIGFGLQNIVNNFVSGLILLIERPIKVGDWVVVGKHEGYVTRISVRATEIQTFERASVIVPNSELLSGAVVNWTHRDKYGRIDLKIGVAYGSDTDKVREILLAAARQHRMVVSWPAPHVLFKNFGDSALEFEMRCYVADVEKHMFVSSDLRFAIDQAFKTAGIEIPYTRRDLTIRNVDEIARAFAAVREAEPKAPASHDKRKEDDGPHLGKIGT